MFNANNCDKSFIALKTKLARDVETVDMHSLEGAENDSVFEGITGKTFCDWKSEEAVMFQMPLAMYDLQKKN